MMSEEKQKKMKNKRNLFFILLIASFMALSCFIIATATDEKPQYTLGDVDGDGKITSTDYLRIKRAFLKEYTLEGTAFALADVDFNNVINSTDYLKIKRSILSDESIDNGEWEKFADKKVIEYCSSPSVFSPSYYANMLGRDDVYLSSDITEENSDEKYYDDIFSYDAYSGLFVVVDSPFEHTQQITETFADGQTVTLNYNSFSMFPTGEYQHSYYCYQKETELTPSTLYYVYTDKNENIVGKRFIHFGENESDKEILSENEIINLAKAKKEELGFSEFTLSSVNKGSKNYTLYFEKRINNLKTPDYLFLSYDKYGVLTEYNSYVGNSEEYDLRGFNSISDKNIYSNVIKEKGDYLLRNFQCECLSSKNPNDYIFSFEITEYFISYDGKMCAKAHVIYDSIDETKSHDHTFEVYFYVLSEEYIENETSAEDESFCVSNDFSNENSSSEYISDSELYSTFLNDQKLDTDCIVYTNGEKKEVGLPFLALMNECGAKTGWINENEVEITLETNEKTIINVLEEQFGIPLAPGSSYGIRKVIDKEIYMDPTTVGLCLKECFGFRFAPSTNVDVINKTVTVKTNT